MTTRLNEQFVDLLDTLSNFMTQKGEFMRARAYKKASEKIMMFPRDIKNINDITSSTSSEKAGIGKTILEKLDEYIKTGKITALEKERLNPINILTTVYGIGPAKAKELIEKGITNISQLKENGMSLLNDKQEIGVKYYDDIIKRIPRSEIDTYKNIFQDNFNNVAFSESTMQIVGSYRRGAQTSGDIDIIITDAKNRVEIFWSFLNKLKNENIIKEFLTEGKTKSLTITQIGELPNRRVDFMFSPSHEFAFAILYFTGSKYFNVGMREQALNMGYSLNEHGFYKMDGKVKGEKIDKSFPDEESIFRFLNMKYKTPNERLGIKSIEILTTKKHLKKPPLVFCDPDTKKNVLTVNEKIKPEIFKLKTKPRNKTLKKKTLTPNERINIFQKNGIDELEKMTEKELEEMIEYANTKYHGEGETPSMPIMTDNEYDIMKQTMEKMYPKNTVIKKVGADIKKNKILLPYSMPSMDKIKPDTNAIDKWRAKYNGPYVISAKADGVSGMFSSENGEQKLYTRGNGIEGGDITHLIPYLNLPTIDNVTIRGEFIVKKEVFKEKYSKDYANPRNFVAGIINREKHLDYSILNDIDFLAYEVISPSMKPSEQMKFLQKNHKTVIQNETLETVDNESLSQKLIDWRKEYSYEIDGIIVANDAIYQRTTKNPTHAFAFKMVLCEQIAEANVVDVIWTPSKHGYLKPKIKIDPVTLSGTTITYATAFNGAFVETNRLGIGSIVRLIRSGDVIPHIMAVIQPATHAKMPDIPYKWNDTKIDVMVMEPEKDKFVQTQNIVAFFKELGVEGLGPGNVQRIVENGFNTIPKIMHMSVEELLNVNGFKERMANKIYSNIRDTVKNVSLSKILSASNIYGRGIGERKIQSILNEYPSILIDHETDKEKYDKVLKINGMAEKTTTLFISKIHDARDFMKQCNLQEMLKVEPKSIEVNSEHELYGKIIVLTGTRDKEIIESLKKFGAKQGASVSNKTYMVIKKDQHFTSTNTEKAETNSINIITVVQFKENYCL